jgi:Calx-beta domain
LTNDSIVDGPRTVVVTLSNVQGGATLGTPATTTLTILDNDLGGRFAFSAAVYTVKENVAGGSFTVTVTRTGGLASGVTVDYAAAGGTAVNGTDYTLTPGTLSFGAGETTKTFTIAITNDTIVNGNRTIVLALSNPTGGASLGLPATTTLTIVDDDVAGSVAFASPEYWALHTDGTATLTVMRLWGAASAVSVDYAAIGGTAVAGVDYTLTAGTLTFGAGEMTKAITVTLLPTANPGTVLIHLTNPVGGPYLGAPSVATLTIE